MKYLNRSKAVILVLSIIGTLTNCHLKQGPRLNCNKCHVKECKQGERCNPKMKIQTCQPLKLNSKSITIDTNKLSPTLTNKSSTKSTSISTLTPPTTKGKRTPTTPTEDMLIHVINEDEEMDGLNSPTLEFDNTNSNNLVLMNNYSNSSTGEDHFLIVNRLKLQPFNSSPGTTNRTKEQNKIQIKVTGPNLSDTQSQGPRNLVNHKNLSVQNGNGHQHFHSTGDINLNNLPPLQKKPSFFSKVSNSIFNWGENKSKNKKSKKDTPKTHTRRLSFLPLKTLTPEEISDIHIQENLHKELSERKSNQLEVKRNMMKDKHENFLKTNKTCEDMRDEIELMQKLIQQREGNNHYIKVAKEYKLRKHKEKMEKERKLNIEREEKSNLLIPNQVNNSQYNEEELELGLDDKRELLFELVWEGNNLSNRKYSNETNGLKEKLAHQLVTNTLAMQVIFHQDINRLKKEIKLKQQKIRDQKIRQRFGEIKIPNERKSNKNKNKSKH